jgi:hypothetical protein
LIRVARSRRRHHGVAGAPRTRILASLQNLGDATVGQLDHQIVGGFPAGAEFDRYEGNLCAKPSGRSHQFEPAHCHSDDDAAIAVRRAETLPTARLGRLRCV